MNWSSLVDLWQSLPQMVRAAATLVAGWLLAIASRWVIGGLFRLLRLDRVSDRIGIGEFLRKGHVAYRPSQLVGMAFFWIVLISAILATARVLDIGVINQFSDSLVSAVPSFLAAILVIVVGLVVVQFLANVAETLMINAAFKRVRLATKAIRWTGVSFIILIAIDQMGLGRGLVSQLFMLAFGAAALGLALAFGIGGAELAKEALQDIVRNLRESERGGHGPDLEG